MAGDLRVLVVEDHPLMRETTSRFLDSAVGLTVVGALDSAEAALDRTGQDDIDVILLDLRLPGRGGIESMGAIRRRYPSARVVVLTMLESDDVRIRAAESGASGFLTKGCAPAELVDGVRRVAAGETVGLSTEPPRAADPERLSRDEVDVLRLLIGSRSVAQIAAELTLPMRTVASLVHAVKTKTRASTRADWLDYALRHDLI